MIKSFKHKGLEKFFVNNDKSKIDPAHVTKLARILDRLDASVCPRGNCKTQKAAYFCRRND
jgi:proteic killer suppression protein